MAHADSVEWLGKIRVFLRSHGWLPEDERTTSSGPDDVVEGEDDDVDERDDAVAREPPA